MAGLALTLVMALALAVSGPQVVLPDPLNTLAPAKAANAKGPITSVARHGDRLLAVGPRGLIMLSTDGAQSWKAVDSPVATDLATVKFIDADTAWAVGHDAVALRSSDGGASWSRVLDGRLLLKLLRTAYDDRSKRGEPDAEKVRKEIERAAEQSATPDVLPTPLFDVWFADAKEGFLLGAFGLLLRTRDGGVNWEPIIEHSENERRFHLYAMGGTGDQRWIAGEQGLLLRWDAAGSRFAKVESPYNGTYFGIDIAGPRVVAYGLRGNAFQSDDAGASWRQIETGVDANLVGLVTLPTTSSSRFVLVSQAGHLLLVQAGGSKATQLQVPITAEVYAAALGRSGSLVFAQVNGLRDIELLGLPAQ